LHDVGTGLTHKRVICWKRYAEGKEPEQVGRETYHSLEAVDRYLGQYDRVRHCHLQGMTPSQTAEILNCSVRLVEEYLKIDQQLQDWKTTGAHATSSKAALEPIPWVDFEIIRRQLTMEQLLSHLGLWQQFRRTRSKPWQWRGPCPFHKVTVTKSKKGGAPFSVNTDENIFQCFEKSCGVTGNVIHFWHFVKDIPLRQAGWDLAQTFGLEYQKGPQESKPQPSQNKDP
jgi:hypothetical protein